MASTYQNIKISGLAELDRKLTDLGPKIARKTGYHATAKGAAVIRDRARQVAHFRGGYSTGYIRENIIQFRPSKRGFGVTKGQGRLACTINVGVRLKGSRKQRLAKMTVRRRRAGRLIKAYPGYYWFMVEFGTQKMAAQPFMRPAFESSSRQALQVTIDTLRADIAKQAGT